MPELTAILLERALSSDSRARRELAEAMVPLIHTRVGRILLCVGKGRGRDGRQEVEDFVQEVLCALFDNNGHALRQWDPQRGASLENFVGLLSERETLSLLRSRRRNPWTDQPTEQDELEPPLDSERNPERLLASREHVGLVLDRTKARLTTELGQLMFQWLIIEARSVEEICIVANMMPDQVYNWRSRLLSLLRKVAQEVLEEINHEPRTPPARTP